MTRHLSWSITPIGMAANMPLEWNDRAKKKKFNMQNIRKTGGPPTTGYQVGLSLVLFTLVFNYARFHTNN